MRVLGRNDGFACVVQGARQQQELHDAALQQEQQKTIAAEEKLKESVGPRVWVARSRATSECCFVGWRSNRGTRS
jgi:hypothetical protein